MRYFDCYCTYTEVYKPKHTYVFTGPCVVTGESYSVTVPADELYAYRRGANIQDAMPSVSAADREFLMTGLSPVGWAKTFSAEEAEEITAND